MVLHTTDQARHLPFRYAAPLMFEIVSLRWAVGVKLLPISVPIHGAFQGPQSWWLSAIRPLHLDEWLLDDAFRWNI